MTHNQITPRVVLRTLLTLMFFCGCTAQAQKFLQPQPILAFSFDNVTSSAVTDDSGSGNVYSIEADDSHGPFRPATSKSFRGSGKAMTFDGTKEQRIKINGPALTVHAFTIMADIRLRNPPRFTDPVNQRWEISEKAGSYWANLRMDQGPVRPGPPYVLRVGGFFDGMGDTTFTGTSGVTPGTWENVAFVFDNVAHTLATYFNGVLDQTQPRAGELSASIDINGIDEALVVGAKERLGGSSEVLEAFFDGQMDNYRLYDRALTSSQVARIAGTPVIPVR